MQNTMLIVDDVEMNRGILKLMFEKEFDIIEATTGLEAQEILEACSGNIDIMLFDLIMPELDGISLLKEHRNDPSMRDMPIVVITSSDHVEDQLQAFEYGANDFIAKPFIPEIVVSRVNNVMSSSRRLVEIQKEKDKLLMQNETDQMTGLYNKMTAERLIATELSLYPRGIHALMVIDIDDFKAVNDYQGHLVGDQTIKVVANQILSLFRNSDIVARIGGDEFLVFMGNLPNHDIARKKANELAFLLKYKPNLTIPANVSLSIGLSFSDREYMNYETMFAQSDEALYEAKKAGKARMSEYGKEIVVGEDLNQEAVLLLSRNRNVCSCVNAALGVNITVMECGDIDSLDRFPDAIKEKLVMSFIDVSGEKDDGKDLWDKAYKKYEWIRSTPVIGVCKESNIPQLKAALEAGVDEILTAPLDLNAVKRISAKFVQSADEDFSSMVIPEETV